MSGILAVAGGGALAWKRMAPLAVAVALRVALVAAYVAGTQWAAAGDLKFYYQFARLSDQGTYPFLHYWMEYPPIFPFLAIGIYRLLGLAQATSAAYFFLALAMLLSLVDLANLLLLHRLARRAHGDGPAGYAALVYAGLPAAIWFSLGWFDPLAVLAMLGGLAALMHRRSALSGVLAGLGAMTKVFPGVLVLAAPVALPARAWLLFLIGALASGAAILAPLAALRADLLAASAEVMLTRQPWETVWALAEGNYLWGILPPMEERTSAASAAQAPGASIGPWPMAVQMALGLLPVWAAATLARAGRRRPQDAYLVVALAVAALLLGARGFSPQFVTWIAPLVLLVWPNRVGLLYALGLTAYLGLHYSALHSWVGAPAHVTLVVLFRTALLAALTVHLALAVRAAVRAPAPAGAGLVS